MGESLNYLSKTTKRALRRHHYYTRKTAILRRLLRQGWYRDNPAHALNQAAFQATTPTPCSCDMCGNPRRHFKEVSLQEKITLDKFKESLYNIYSD